MQPTGELNQRGRVQRLKEGAVHASEVDRGVLAHRLHSESDQRPRRYPDHPLWVTSPQFGQGEVNGYRSACRPFPGAKPTYKNVMCTGGLIPRIATPVLRSNQSTLPGFSSPCGS